MLKNKTLDLSKCDVIKVFMMLSVMFYHCICLWSRGGWFNQAPQTSSNVLAFACSLFNSFHIYVFVFVSGYIFYYLKYEKNRYNSFLRDVLHRSKRLLLPYLVASVFWVIPFSIYYFSPTPLDVFKNFGLAMAPSQLWFLIMIFVVFVIFYLISDVFNRCGYVSGVLLSILIYVVSTLGGYFIPNLFQIWTAGKYIFFYYMGFAFRKYSNNVLYKIPWLCYFIVFILLFSFNFFYVSKQDVMIFKLITLAIVPVKNTFGVLTVIIGLSKFEFSKIKNTKVYSLLSKHNFVMYILHQQLIYITISLFNYKVSTPLLVLINFVFSFLGSLLLSVLISKIPYVKKAFGYK